MICSGCLVTSPNSWQRLLRVGFDHRNAKISKHVRVRNHAASANMRPKADRLFGLQWDDFGLFNSGRLVAGSK